MNLNGGMYSATDQSLSWNIDSHGNFSASSLNLALEKISSLFMFIFTGYIYNWHVYCGANERRNDIQSILIELTQSISNRGHLLCFDSYFTSVPIVRYLATKGIGSLGMPRKDRRLIPNDIRNPPSNMQRGECIFRASNNLLSLLYKDKRDIRILTNSFGQETDNNGRPAALNAYNQLMHGDISNQYISYYHFGHKSVKWYKALFISTLETSISNAFQLYKLKNPNTRLSSLKFREELAYALIQNSLNWQHLRLLARPEPRIIRGLHMISTRKQRNCYICSTAENRKTTSYFCVICDENVCPEHVIIFSILNYVFIRETNGRTLNKVN